MNKKPLTQYGVFIIESLSFDNEKNEECDGWIIKQVLDLCKIPNEYYYIRTKKELEEIMSQFAESELRFLHFSAHGNNKIISTTLDKISYEEFANIIGPFLSAKRLFLSACEASNELLAKHLIKKFHCYSVIGNPTKVSFDKSAVFWSSFYQCIYEKDEAFMKQPYIMGVLKNLTKVFEIQINYYSFLKNGRRWNNNDIKLYEVFSNRETIRHDISVSEI